MHNIWIQAIIIQKESFHERSFNQSADHMLHKTVRCKKRSENKYLQFPYAMYTCRCEEEQGRRWEDLKTSCTTTIRLTSSVILKKISFIVTLCKASIKLFSIILKEGEEVTR